MKKGFTLIEVNLAMLIMSTGILVMCGLYSLGFRENRQSVEDVAAASFADAYLGPLVQGLSSTNLQWSTWVTIGDAPSRANTKNFAQGVWPKDGWKHYIQEESDGGYRVKGDPSSVANSEVWNKIQGKIPTPYKPAKPSLDSKYTYALVATRRGPVIQLAFRCARRKESLMSQPLIVSEVHFQGDPER